MRSAPDSWRGDLIWWLAIAIAMGATFWIGNGPRAGPMRRARIRRTPASTTNMACYGIVLGAGGFVLGVAETRAMVREMPIRAEPA